MADETTQTTAEQSAETTPESAQGANVATGAAKTFTQDEVNDLIKARLERERKGQPTKDELAAFRAWQDEQKTAEQKQEEAVKAQADRADAAEKKAAALEAKLLAASKGVSPEAADDVVALASLKVSEETPLETAIDEVLKKYPQFTGTSAPRTTGVPAGSGGAAVSGVEAAFRAKNPNIKF